jgi:hypothetical protein
MVKNRSRRREIGHMRVPTEFILNKKMWRKGTLLKFKWSLN